MKNIEKYKDKLISLFTTVCPQLIASVVIQINPSINSDSEAVNWLCKEAKEEIELSNIMYDLLKQFYKFNFKYIARSNNNILLLFFDKPKKDLKYWISESPSFVIEKLYDVFDFIKWEDEEPYLIADILERAKVVDDE